MDFKIPEPTKRSPSISSKELMTNKSPKVSVIMPVYNGEKYIREAIDSILAQAFSDFELIIIDDNSTDNTIAIIRSYIDARLILKQNAHNLGSSMTRNVGINESRGEYIAFLDSDDWSFPSRLQKQVKFLNEHLDFGFIGSAVQAINDVGDVTNDAPWKFPAPPEQIPSILIFNNYFALSAVMIRKIALPVELFRTDYIPSEDYDLWNRVSNKWKMWNLQETLIKRRSHKTSLSKIQSDKYARVMPKIYADLFDNLGLTYDNADLELHYLYCYGYPDISKTFLRKIAIWFYKIYRANKTSGLYDETYLLKETLSRWYRLCIKCSDGKSVGLYLFMSSDLFKEYIKNPKKTAKIIYMIIRRTFTNRAR
jgi:glycosyltransferase involved in cell wall biosynthesis